MSLDSEIYGTLFRNLLGESLLLNGVFPQSNWEISEKG